MPLMVRQTCTAVAVVRGALCQRLHALVQGCAVAQRFLGRRIRRSVRAVGELKQAVGCGDDILDFRAGLSLQHRNRVDQDGLIWNQVAGKL